MTSLFVSPDGQEFEVDDPTLPATAQWIKQQGMRQKMFDAKDAVKSGISGLAEGTARAPLIMSDIAKLIGVGANKVVPGTISDKTMNMLGSQGWIDAFRGSDEDKMLKNDMHLDLTHQPGTTAGEYIKPIASAISGAATTGGMGSAPGLVKSANSGMSAAKAALSPAMLAINGGAGAAGQLGYDASRGFDPTREGNPLIALLASAGFGLGGSTARQMFSPNGRQTVYNATKGMTDEQWSKTMADAKDFRQSGSGTWTLADLPELQPRLGGTAQGLSNTTGGDLLQQRLSLQERMNKDIPNLFGKVNTEVHPGDVDPRELAKVLAAKGEGRINQMVKTRGTAMEGTLGNAPDADPAALNTNVAKLIRMQMIQGKNSSEGTQQALGKAEEALLGKGARTAPYLISPTAPGGYAVVPKTTNVQALSKDVKSLRDIPTSDTNSAKTAITRYDRMTAGNLAEEALSQTSPAFRKAMDQYRTTTEHLVEPTERSLVGTVRDAKDGNGLLTKLRGVPLERLQGEINSLGMTDKEIRAMAKVVGQRLDVMPNLTKVSDTVKQDREIFRLLVDAVDPDLAVKVGKKLSVADALSRLSAEHSTDRTMNLNLGNNSVSNVVNPFGVGARRASLRTTEKEAAALSELIGNPTKSNLDKLHQLSKIDPRAKRYLEWLGTGAGSITSSQSVGDTR